MAMVDWLKNRADGLRQFSAQEVRPLPIIGAGMLFLAGGFIMERSYLTGVEEGLRRGLDNLLKIGTTELGGGVSMFQLYDGWDLLGKQWDSVGKSIRLTEVQSIASVVAGLVFIGLDQITNLRIPKSDWILPGVANLISRPTPDQKPAA